MAYLLQHYIHYVCPPPFPGVRACQLIYLRHGIPRYAPHSKFISLHDDKNNKLREHSYSQYKQIYQKQIENCFCCINSISPRKRALNIYDIFIFFGKLPSEGHYNKTDGRSKNLSEKSLQKYRSMTFSITI